MHFLALCYKGIADGADIIVKRSDILLYCGAPAALLSAKELSYTITVRRVMEKHFNEEMLLAYTQSVCMWRWGLTF